MTSKQSGNTILPEGQKLGRRGRRKVVDIVSVHLGDNSFLSITRLTGEPVSAVEQLQAGASHVMASAAAEGQRDVEPAKAASASYIGQAKSLDQYRML
jgi:hypothetical protein